MSARRQINGRTRKKGFDVVGEKEPERKLFNGAELSLACERWLARREGISVEQLRANSIMRRRYER
jgi:hypothetical protein